MVDETVGTIKGCLGSPSFGDCFKLGLDVAATATGVLKAAKVLNDMRRIGKLRDFENAASALPAFPTALSGGSADTYVYLGVRDGKSVYTGITNDLGRRGAQHADHFDGLRQVTATPVTRGQARSIEQALIVRNPGFENKINSISPTHAYYDDAVSWGEAWLRQNGF